MITHKKFTSFYSVRVVLIGVCVFGVASLKDKDPMRIVDNAIIESQRAVLVAADFDYKGFLSDASFRMQDFKFNRFSETYTVNFKSYGDTGAVVNNVKGICSSTFGCKVGDYNKWSSEFTSDGQSQISVIVPINEASGFVGKFGDGKMAEVILSGSHFASTPLDKDITLYTLRIDAYKSLHKVLMGIIGQANGDIAKIKSVEKYLADVDFRIAAMQRVVNYLNDVKPYARVNIIVSKQYSSLLTMIYDKSVQGLVWFFKYFNFVLLATLALLFMKFSFCYIPMFVEKILNFISGVHYAVKEKIGRIARKKSVGSVTKLESENVASDVIAKKDNVEDIKAKFIVPR